MIREAEAHYNDLEELAHMVGAGVLVPRLERLRAQARDAKL
jgi:hypothetical protein